MRIATSSVIKEDLLTRVSIWQKQVQKHTEKIVFQDKND